MRRSDYRVRATDLALFALVLDDVAITVVVIGNVEALGRAEVDELDVTILVDHDVFGLEVTVHDAFSVEVLKNEDNGANVELGLLLIEQADLLHHCEETHAVDVLVEKVDEVSVCERSVVLHYKGKI